MKTLHLQVKHTIIEEKITYEVQVLFSFLYSYQGKMVFYCFQNLKDSLKWNHETSPYKRKVKFISNKMHYCSVQDNQGFCSYSLIWSDR